MLQALPYALGYLLPPIVILSVRAGGVWAFAPGVVLFLVFPVLDALSGRQHVADDEHARTLEDNWWFRVVTWGWVPIQLALLAWGLNVAASGHLDGVTLTGLTIGLGLCTGTVGMTFAHELVHRSSLGERALGEMLLTSVSYPHFAIEHVYGHHRHVGTPGDPSTARFGESLYRFLPRTVSDGLRSAVRIESSRMRRRYGRLWHPANRIVRYAVLQVLVYEGVALGFGSVGIVVFAAQALVAIVQLEGINYMEHYGLVRRETAPGVYERIQPIHSWDSHYRGSNWLLLNLARHADHHCLASRRYPALQALESTPQFPAGFGAMFLLAFVPPLWHRIMDPRVRRWRAVHGV